MSESTARQKFEQSNAVAIRKAGIEGWLPYAWEVVDPHSDGLIVTGSVPVGVFQRGPRKGRPKWDPKHPTTRRVIVMPQDLGPGNA